MPGSMADAIFPLGDTEDTDTPDTRLWEEHCSSNMWTSLHNQPHIPPMFHFIGMHRVLKPLRFAGASN